MENKKKILNMFVKFEELFCYVYSKIIKQQNGCYREIGRYIK